MIIPARYSALVFNGSLVLIGVGILATIVVMSLRSSRELRAKKAGQPRPPRSIFAWVAPLLIVAGAATQVWDYGFDTEVWVVTDASDGALRAEHGIARSKPEDMVIIPVSFEPFHPLWVINRSSHTLRLETLQYGSTPMYLRTDPTPPLEIPPASAVDVNSVDYVGPDDKPADKVLGSREYGASRRWLTW